MDFADYCREFEREGERLVARVPECDVDAGVPGCPEWRVGDLLAHVGSVHRWVRHLVAVRATRRISPRDMDFARGPVGAPWLAEGVADLLATFAAHDEHEPMWAWGADQHVGFWARRMLHETLVHRLDLDAATGVAAEVDASIAADAIDEFLVNLGPAAAFSPTVANLVGEDEVIAFVTEGGPTWLVGLTPRGFAVIEESSRIDAALRGSPLDVLLTLYRRRTLEGSSCALEGRRDLLERWWDNSALP